MSAGQKTGPGADGVHHPYQYVILRCVPRADREEFVNVGVVVYCQALEYLGCSWTLDEHRLSALWPELDTARVAGALRFVEAVCAAEQRVGVPAAQSLTQRFGLLMAPRSTVLRPGPVHGGTSADPAQAQRGLLAVCCGP